MQTTTGLAAVLFDMDGTLVDSEKVWTVALYELAEKLGGRLSDAARAAMVGTNMSRSMAILHDDLGLPADRDTADSVAWLEDRMGELFADGLVWKPGAQELLAAVAAADIPAALVTATRRRLVETALETIGRRYFAAVVCGDDLDETKPHPAPYRTAATLLGVPPARCVAIEDSPTGLASARAAGCVVVGIPSEVDLTGTPGVTLVDSLTAVDVSYLRSLVA
ncbi:HAD family hydrolase [Actinocatenispora rupis]|uniref:Haloacid dehalogenase n=1 Tax=Actinocatenispora rupis TaxID=519421 RepID=A0A8J3IYF5_9ACTN|nr:HAD family phosphatase [Actinocatenispora rupis]GID11100.1 haloacid dehalogenase [Actinocatenispora rupis]